MMLTPLYPEGKVKALTFSYDDGSRDDIRLVGIFNRFGMKATFNLIGSQFGCESRVHADEAKTLYAGHEIASHSFTHPFLDRIPKARALNELLLDRRELEKVTGSIVNGFALPFGSWNAETLELLRTVGYLYSRTTLATMKFKLPEDFLEWHPTCHHRDAEGLCEAFTWYATNGEIVRYISALKRLETSVDVDRIFNPTAYSLWFRKGSGETIELKPGETLALS